MLYLSLKRLSFTVALLALVCAGAFAQTTTPRQPAATPSPDILVVEPSVRQSPQIVTVIHRLNGIKALALLRRSGEAVSMADDEVIAAPNAVTSIIAGYALSDGQNIVARIPQAEAEVEALTLYGPGASQWRAQPAPPAQRAGTAAGGARVFTPAPSTGFVVVQADGKQLAARYVGLDGSSGLSLLRIYGLKVPASREAVENSLTVGQPVRLFAPARVARGSNTSPGTIALRVGEIEGRIADISRTSTGKIARITVSAEKLSPAIAGGVALNEAGEIVGIVELSDANSARLIPVAAVRRAAERLLARQTSVPRPWLGVRGEAVTTTPFEKFFSIGWNQQEVEELKKKYQGVLLTSVAPGTPAALANLRPGDVIVRANNFEIKSAEDFSYVLNEAGSGATVNFTLLRGQTPKATALFQPPQPVMPPAPANPPAPFKFESFVVSVKLRESFNPAMTMQMAEAPFGIGGQPAINLPAVARGLETVQLSTKAAAHMGARGGLLVVYVDPESAAGRAGLRVFDVIETIDGKPLGTTSWHRAVPAGNLQQLLLGVVREKQKIEITVRQREDKK